MNNDEIQPLVRPVLVADVPDIAETVREACALYAIVTVAQAEQFFQKPDAWSRTRTRLGITEGDLENAREAIRPYRPAMKNPSRDYAAIPCGITLAPPVQSALQEAPPDVSHDKENGSDEGGSDDA